MCDVTVLLAVYNGELYLREALDSIVNQSEKVSLVARDDFSTDGSLQILREYEEKSLCFVRRGVENKGVIANFNELASDVCTPYIAFADQDDIWHEDKLSLQMTMMRQLEKVHGVDTPILVHSDLSIIDHCGRTLAPSLWRYQKLNPKKRSFARLLVQNNITGCTVLINKALKDLAFPVPEGAVMHDWWLALVAAACGVIGYIPRTLVQYRQHDKNQLGAVAADLFGAMARMSKIDPKCSLKAAQTQASIFHDHFRDQPEFSSVLHLADAYAQIGRSWYGQKLWTLYKNDFWKQDLLRNIGLIWNI